MVELYLSKVTETSGSEQAGKLYARVSYKEALGAAKAATALVVVHQWTMAATKP